MALYVFDGTGDNWDTAPAKNANLQNQTSAFEKIGPESRTNNGRFLTNVVSGLFHSKNIHQYV